MSAAVSNLWHVYEPLDGRRWREHVHRLGRELAECGIPVIGPDVVHADQLPDNTPDEAVVFCATCAEISE